jgi:dienelactone hydrolase
MSRRVLAAALGLLAWAGICGAAPTPEDYGRLPAVEFMCLSPSGERYAFVAVVDGLRRFMVLGYEGKVLFSAKVGDAKVRNVTWAGDDHVLIRTSTTYDDPFDFLQAFELGEVLKVDVAAGRMVPVFDRNHGIANTVGGYYGWRHIDGHDYGWFGGITYMRTTGGDYVLEHTYHDLYRVDLATGEAVLDAHGSDSWHDWLLAADGAVFAHSEYADRSGQWKLYAGKSEGKPLLSRKASLEGVEMAGAGRSEGTVLVVDSSSDEDVTEELVAADGKTENLFAGLTVEHLLRDPDSGLLIGAITQESPGAVFFDPKLQARYDGTRKAFPGLEMHLVSYSRKLDRLIVQTEGSGDPGTYWMVDIASGKADEIGHPYPSIREQDVGEVRSLRYAAGDGTSLEGILTLPPARKAEKLPLVVMPHGGPFGFRDQVGFDWWAQAYAAAGYAVLQPNYRGSGGYGVAFRKAGFGEWGGKMLGDIAAGIAPLAQQGLIDPARVCIVGASYGGYAALAGVTLQHGLYRCAVAVAGISDMSRFFDWAAEGHGYRSGETRYLRAATGADKGGDKVLHDISPLRLADQADAPVLLVHGKDDTRVPIEQSELMAAALKHAGKPYDYVVLPGEDHFLSRESTRLAMLKAAVAFVKKYNPPD